VPGQESVGEGRFDGWNEMLLAWDTTRNLAKFVLSQSCATVGGTVKNANGDGVAGIPVFVEPYDLDPHRRIEPALRVITDSKGRYSVSGLTPGVYRMLASFDYQMPDAAQMEAAQALKVTVDGGTHASLDLEEFVIR
jgi:hypothetical protein